MKLFAALTIIASTQIGCAWGINIGGEHHYYGEDGAWQVNKHGMKIKKTIDLESKPGKTVK